jgi:hypothetical protein
MSRYVFVLETTDEPHEHVKQEIEKGLHHLGALCLTGRVYHGFVESETLLTDPNDVASSKQLWFLNKLIGQAEDAIMNALGTERGDLLSKALTPVLELQKRGTITKSEASQAIDQIKGALEAG